jgi:hypothetical protein
VYDVGLTMSMGMVRYCRGNGEVVGCMMWTGTVSDCKGGGGRWGAGGCEYHNLTWTGMVSDCKVGRRGD